MVQVAQIGGRGGGRGNLGNAQKKTFFFSGGLPLEAALIDPGDDDKAKVGKVKYTQHCTDSSNFGES